MAPSHKPPCFSERPEMNYSIVEKHGRKKSLKIKLVSEGGSHEEKMKRAYLSLLQCRLHRKIPVTQTLRQNNSLKLNRQTPSPDNQSWFVTLFIPTFCLSISDSVSAKVDCIFILNMMSGFMAFLTLEYPLHVLFRKCSLNPQPQIHPV